MNDDIKNWLDEQNTWIQQAAFRILSNGIISDTDIEDFVDLIKNPPTSPQALQYSNIGSGSTSNDDVAIKSMGPIEGIDALNPRAPIDFSASNLSIVYGSNGSGKSGYARILKKITGKSGALELKANIFETAPASRKCTISYSCNGQDRNVDWVANSSQIDELTSAAIFDTMVGDFYLLNETEISYTPPEIMLFERLVDVCVRTKTALQNERDQLKSKLPKLQARFQETKHGVYYTHQLKSSITPENLDKFLLWTEKHAQALSKLKKRLETKDPKAEAKKKRAIKANTDRLRSELKSTLATVSAEAREKLSKLCSDAQTKRSASNKSAQLLADKSIFSGIDSAEWKEMWMAAKAYSSQHAYPDTNFPNTKENNHCVLCQQELSDEAKERFESFDGFISGTLEKNAVEAENLVKAALKALPQRPEIDALETQCQALNRDDAFEAKLCQFWESISLIVEKLKKRDFTDGWPDLNNLSGELEAELLHYSDSLEEGIEQLEKDAKEFDREKAQQDLLEYEAKKLISEQAEAVRDEVDRLKLVDKYQNWEKLTSTTALSRKSSSLSETLITDSYIARFNQELATLGARSIRVELAKTRTSRGRNKHIVRLKNVTFDTANITDILSEGERRIVVLAAFLADVTGRPGKAPFIFDDPITSLDQDYEEKVIARLLELSADRQLIVFTHRLSFLGIMQDKADKDAALPNANVISIRREPWGTGQETGMPIFGRRPDKALNLLLNERFPKAKKASDEDGYDAYYPLAKAICSDFRILIERIVELTLLADVIQRHRRAINTMGKLEKLTRISEDDCTFIDEMMTKYSCYEHSQSLEAPVDVPPADELQTDISSMVDWHRDFGSR